MSGQLDDWRLQGQEQYLKGASLVWTRYRAPREDWDHDHCEFCLAKFSEDPDISDALREGWSTLDQYRWICATCFEDFKETFGFKEEGHTS